MATAPEIEKCVVFLARKEKDGEYLTGTAFLLDEYVGEANTRITYLVTARHVIERIQAKGIGNRCWVRLNLKGNRLESIPMDLSHWVFHDDIRVDVAIAPGNWNDEDEHLSIPVGLLASDEWLRQSSRIRPGTLLYFPGLFIHHPGEAQILPIIRQGSIAAMPREWVKTKGDIPRQVYLIEARSIGGLSGSPVFVDYGLHLENTQLLGIVHGHFGCNDIPDNDVMDEVELTDSQKSPSVNMGIGMVVPAQRILEVLQQPELLAVKAKLANRVR